MHRRTEERITKSLDDKIEELIKGDLQGQIHQVNADLQIQSEKMEENKLGGNTMDQIDTEYQSSTTKTLSAHHVSRSKDRSTINNGRHEGDKDTCTVFVDNLPNTITKKKNLSTTVNITSTDRKIRSRTGEVRKNFETEPESKKMKNRSDEYQGRTALARKRKKMKDAGPFKNIVKIGTRTKGRFQAMEMRFLRSLENFKTLLRKYAGRKTREKKNESHTVSERAIKKLTKKREKKPRAYISNGNVPEGSCRKGWHQHTLMKRERGRQVKNSLGVNGRLQGKCETKPTKSIPLLITNKMCGNGTENVQLSPQIES